MDLEKENRYVDWFRSLALECAPVKSIENMGDFMAFLKSPNAVCIGAGGESLVFRIKKESGDPSGYVIKIPYFLPTSVTVMIDLMNHVRKSNDFTNPNSSLMSMDMVYGSLTGPRFRQNGEERYKQEYERSCFDYEKAIAAHYIGSLKNPKHNIAPREVFVFNGKIVGFSLPEVRGEKYRFDDNNEDSRRIAQEYLEAGGAERRGANILLNATSIDGEFDYVFLDLRGLPQINTIYDNI